MDTNILLGVPISLILFLITYQKTIGAKKERIKITYNEVVKILIRNLVTNKTVLTISEISRLIQIKSIENKINIADLPNEITFIYALYTRIAEDEILSPEQKKELLRQINDYLKSTEEKPFQVIDEEKLVVDKKEKYRFFLLASFSIIFATLSLIFYRFLFIKKITIDLSDFIIYLSITGVVLAITIQIIKLKEKQEETTSSVRSFLKDYKDFEERIFKILKNTGELSRKFLARKNSGPPYLFDALLKSGQRSFLIEVKMVRRYTPRIVIERLKKQGKIAKAINKNYELILVINNKKYLHPYLNELNKVWDYVFDEEELKEFRNKLIHK